MIAANELTDRSVTLRPMTPADAELHLAGEDEQTVRFLSWGRSTMETVLAWIEHNRTSLEESGPVRAFGICLTTTGTLVGMVETNMATSFFRSGVANITYGLYPDARGHGYATIAVSLAMRYLVAHTDTDVAAIQVHPENVASSRIPERLGFCFLGNRKASESDQMRTYAKPLRRPVQLRLSDVCQHEPIAASHNKPNASDPRS